MPIWMSASPHQAPKILDNGGWTPDLALIDVVMPEMTGIDLMTAFRLTEATTHLPIIFVTGHAQQYHNEGLMAAGALAVIAKPFDPLTLAESVRQIWSKHCLFARHKVLPRGGDELPDNFCSK